MTYIQAFIRNLRTGSMMVREKAQVKPHEAESTEASIRGAPPRSSDEAPVIGVERRGRVVQSESGQPEMGRTSYLDERRQPFVDCTSRMTGDCHVRICERLGVRFPGPTRRPTNLECAWSGATAKHAV